MNLYYLSLTHITVFACYDQLPTECRVVYNQTKNSPKTVTCNKTESEKGPDND